MNIEQMPQQPLKKDEAHDEANMIRSELKVDSVLFGRMWKDGRLTEKPKAEDYDRALEVVEEIKLMAEKEPLVQKALIDISRLAVKSGYGVLEVFSALSSGISGDSTKDIYQDKLEVLKKIESASARLKSLRAGAKEFGESENKTVE